MEYIDENGETQYTGEETTTFEDGVKIVQTVVNEPEPSGPITGNNAWSYAPNKADSRHVYVGRDSRGDVWQTIDEGGNVVEWASAPGAPSSNLIPGTVANLGPPSSMSAAKPASIAAAAVAAAAASPAPDDPSHRYAGTDARGDHYELTDAGGRVIAWTVKINDDSRNMLPGSASVVSQPGGPAIPAGGSPSNPGGTPSPRVPGGGIAVTGGDHIPDDPAHRYVGTDNFGDWYELTDAGGNRIRWQVKTNDDSRNPITGSLINYGKAPAGAITRSDMPNPKPAGPGVPGGELINPAPDTTTGNFGAPKQTDTRHKYVGRIGSRDYWQIFDGTNVIEWQTAAGEESGRSIAGTARNLGPPSAATVAQNDGTVVTPPPAPISLIPPANSGPLVGEGAKNLILIGLAAASFGLKIFQ